MTELLTIVKRNQLHEFAIRHNAKRIYYYTYRVNCPKCQQNTLYFDIKQYHCANCKITGGSDELPNLLNPDQSHQPTTENHS